jgi:hypothetical protein
MHKYDARKRTPMAASFAVFGVVLMTAKRTIAIDIEVLAEFSGERGAADAAVAPW